VAETGPFTFTIFNSNIRIVRLFCACVSEGMHKSVLNLAIQFVRLSEVLRYRVTVTSAVEVARCDAT